MSFTLAAAAAATGLSKTTILRAIKDGRISGTRDERGVWYVEPGDLHVLGAGPVAPPNDDQSFSQTEIDDLGAQIEELLQRAGDRLREQIDAVRGGYDPARDQHLLFADHDERT
jgi:hypothetical protein